MRILALDYGSRRLGVAVSDSTGTLARPLEAVERVGTPDGLAALLAIVAREDPELIVVGLPRLPSGAVGQQAGAAMAFAGRLRGHVSVPIELEDERFTTTIAERSTRRKSTSSSLDSRAAAVLLQGVLDRRTASS
jgi:putative Holliday junction resolvase